MHFGPGRVLHSERRVGVAERVAYHAARWREPVASGQGDAEVTRETDGERRRTSRRAFEVESQTQGPTARRAGAEVVPPGLDLE